MKIAGVWLQKIKQDPKIQHAVSEPYGLEMILAIAQSEGHQVDLFLPVVEKEGNIQSSSEAELVERIVNFNPDVVAFSIYTSQYPMSSRIAAQLKRRIPETIIIAGNRYPTFLKERIEKPFDFFVLKEGEKTFSELLREIEDGKNYNRVKGISFRKNGHGIFTGFRERVSDLDNLPYALRFDVILKQVYRAISVPPLSSNPHYAIMEYSRACFNHCRFCDSKEFWGNNVVFRSTGKVIQEMFELQQRGADIFYFMDLNFTADLQRAKKLCEEMIKQRLNASWYCMSNIGTLIGNEWILDIMKEAGCYKIAWGIESTNDRFLAMMDKSTKGILLTNDHAQKVLQASSQKGIINQGFYIIGFPWETAESIARDGEALKYMSLHQLNIGIFTPIPLSEFFNRMIAEGYEFTPDLEKYDRNCLVYKHKALTPEITKSLQEKLYQDFYSTPGYLGRIRESSRINPDLKKAFNDYFEFMGKDIIIK
jgi:radical SAM superfamily enzyme YgiQ (UPF0313 family)